MNEHTNMDIQKLKLDRFRHIQVVNFPADITTGITSTDMHVEVIIYYIDRLSDVDDFVLLCRKTPLPKENRTILVYKKGRKDGVNRDSIFMPLVKGDKHDGFKLKAPMMCSVSNELSACVMCFEASEHPSR